MFMLFFLFFESWVCILVGDKCCFIDWNMCDGGKEGLYM